jgi:diketogulonate reductase-like aldo/keto reductase
MADYFCPIVASRTKLGIAVPAIIYGTAEKQHPSIIFSAIAEGVTGLDTACQPKYYHEEVVGEALQQAFQKQSQGGLGMAREDIYIQTKFTTPGGHSESTAPYLAEDSIHVKVQKSIEMSLKKLGLKYVDALLLHAPMPTMPETLEVWKAMEELVGMQTRLLGVCNVNLHGLRAICAAAKVEPSIVQNKFWKENEYDQDLREYCKEKDIVYQAFWVLKANHHLLASNLLGWLAKQMVISREDALFLAVLSMGTNGSGMSILTGTKSTERLARTAKTIVRLGAMPPILSTAFTSLLQEEQQI